MFSVGEKIGILSALIDKIKHFIELQTDYLKLSAVEKMVRLLSLTVCFLVGLILVLPVIFFASLALACFLSSLIDSLIGGFCIVAGFYLLLLVLFYVFRKPLVMRPVCRMLVNIFLKDHD